MLTIKTTTRRALNLSWNVRPVRRANLIKLRKNSLPPSSEFFHQTTLQENSLPPSSESYTIVMEATGFSEALTDIYRPTNFPSQFVRTLNLTLKLHLTSDNDM
jgi:hypothetical protein